MDRRVLSSRLAQRPESRCSRKSDLAAQEDRSVRANERTQ